MAQYEIDPREIVEIRRTLQTHNRLMDKLVTAAESMAASLQTFNDLAQYEIDKETTPDVEGPGPKA